MNGQSILQEGYTTMAVSAVRLRNAVLVLAACATGCSTQAAPLYPLADEPAPPPALATRFDVAATGSISGRVVWNGAKPESHSFRDAGVHPGSFADSYDGNNWLVPRINARNDGIVAAVVSLRKVDPERSRPWDLSPVRVVMRSQSIAAEQGGEYIAGFVHAGDTIKMQSEGAELELLRARGAAFFTLPFPKPDKPVTRTLAQAGMVEFSSAAGNFWARCWLFVAEHPYYVRTDESGKFSLEHVPDGDYELVCWLPDWRVERFERDPETHEVARVWFRKPLEKSMAVRVERGQITKVDFTVGLTEFGK
jgi:hypothetical protein